MLCGDRSKTAVLRRVLWAATLTVLRRGTRRAAPVGAHRPDLACSHDYASADTALLALELIISPRSGFGGLPWLGCRCSDHGRPLVNARRVQLLSRGRDWAVASC